MSDTFSKISDAVDKASDAIDKVETVKRVVDTVKNGSKADIAAAAIAASGVADKLGDVSGLTSKEAIKDAAKNAVKGKVIGAAEKALGESGLVDKVGAVGGLTSKEAIKDKAKDVVKDKAQSALEGAAKKAMGGMDITAKTTQIKSEAEVVKDYMSGQKAKEELMSNMDITAKTTQVKSEAEVVSDYLDTAKEAPAKSKEELMADMDIDYSSKQVKSEEEVTQEYLAGNTGSPAVADAASGAEGQFAAATGSRPAPMAIGSLNQLVIDLAVLKACIIRLHESETEGLDCTDEFILMSTDESYECIKTVKDDLILGDAYLDLLYEDLDASKSYRLTIRAKDSAEPILLFDNVTYADLTGLSA